MHLLKNGVPFVWYNQAQWSFDTLNKALMSTPLLSSHDYSQEFFLYLIASKSTIDMVLIQEDDAQWENIIYYLSKGVAGPKLW